MSKYSESWGSGAILDEKENMLYTWIEDVGAGTFGNVVKAKINEDHLLVAVKSLTGERREQNAQKEIEMLKKVSTDPAIITSLHFFTFNKIPRIIMPAMEISIKDFMYRSHGLINFQDVVKILTQLLSGLMFLKKKSIIHTDLKSDNIMFITTKESQRDIKMVDFGSALTDPNKKQGATVQSLFIRAPEVILGLPFGVPIDMWSLGCLAAELVMRYPLYSGQNEDHQLIYLYHDGKQLPISMISQGKHKLKYFHQIGNGYVWKERFYEYSTLSRSNNYRYLEKKLEKMVTADSRMLNIYEKNTTYEEFLNLINSLLTVDPKIRITPEDAAAHRLFSITQNMTNAGTQNCYLNPSQCPQPAQYPQRNPMQWSGQSAGPSWQQVGPSTSMNWPPLVPSTSQSRPMTSQTHPSLWSSGQLVALEALAKKRIKESTLQRPKSIPVITISDSEDEPKNPPPPAPQVCCPHPIRRSTIEYGKPQLFYPAPVHRVHVKSEPQTDYSQPQKKQLLARAQSQQNFAQDEYPPYSYKDNAYGIENLLRPSTSQAHREHQFLPPLPRNQSIAPMVYRPEQVITSDPRYYGLGHPVQVGSGLASQSFTAHPAVGVHDYSGNQSFAVGPVEPQSFSIASQSFGTSQSFSAPIGLGQSFTAVGSNQGFTAPVSSGQNFAGTSQSFGPVGASHLGQSVPDVYHLRMPNLHLLQSNPQNLAQRQGLQKEEYINFDSLDISRQN